MNSIPNHPELNIENVKSTFSQILTHPNSEYKGYRQGSYLFKDGTKTNSVKRLLERLNPQEKIDSLGLYILSRFFERFTQAFVETAQSLSIERQWNFSSSETQFSGLEMEQTNPQFVEKLKLCKIYKVLNDPGQNTKSGRRVIFHSTVTNQIIGGFCDETLLELYGTSMAEVKKAPLPICTVGFNPLQKERIAWQRDSNLGTDVAFVNLANPPLWLLKHSPDVKPALTGFIKTLIFHLFPGEEDRELVLDWMHHALVKRAATVLVLLGSRGTGKTTFARIMTHLIGQEYSEVLSDSVLNDKFNSQFKNKRFLQFEEVGIRSNDQVNKIKAWCNDRIAFERKGEDATSIENFSSFAFLLNEVEDFQIDASERRFSIPSITDTPLTDVVSEEEIGKFLEAIDGQTQAGLDMLAEFGYFLQERKPKVSNQTAIRGARFFEITDKNMAIWKTYLKQYIAKYGKSGEFIHVSEIFPLDNTGKEKAEFKGIPRKRQRFEDFLNNYKHLGKCKIAYCVDEPEGYREQQSQTKRPAYGAAMRDRSKRDFGFISNDEFLKLVQPKDEDLL